MPSPETPVRVPSRLHLFPDFHLHGAHDPQWRQQYAQLSPGVMRSRLAAWVTPGAQVFHKWMSERVVQQGGLPQGWLCLSLLDAPPAGASRMQGQALEADSLFVLRPGEEFEIQRPEGLALLSLSLPRDAVLAALDTLPLHAPARQAATQTALRLPAPALQRLRLALRTLLKEAPVADAAAAAATWEQMLLAEVLAALAHAQAAPARASSRRAARVVRDCHRLVSTDDGAAPPTVDDLSRRLATSRRTLQNSFQQTAGISPVQYLRGVRLNGVRQRILATPAQALSVSQAATDQGFDHLSHFAQAYKQLFGELPSRTARATLAPRTVSVPPASSAGAQTGQARYARLAPAAATRV